MSVKITTTLKARSQLEAEIKAANIPPLTRGAEAILDEIQRQWGPFSPPRKGPAKGRDNLGSQGDSLKGFRATVSATGIRIRNPVGYSASVHRPGQRQPEIEQMRADIEPIVLPDLEADLAKSMAAALGATGPERKV